MEDQFNSVGINIIVEQISSGIRIISREYSFGDMVLQLEFSVSKGSHIDTTSKGPKVVDVISLGFIFLNRRSNCISFWK